MEYSPVMSTSLAEGRDLVAIPGPTVVPDRVLSAMNRPMPDIYAGELLDVTTEVFDRLPSIARTESRAFVTISNGHGAWEMALTNSFSRGDKLLVLVSGLFAALWGDMATFLGLEVEVLTAEPRQAIDPVAVEEFLRSDQAHSIKAVLVVHVDTASSVRNDIPGIRRAIDASHHPALLMVDSIASIGCEKFEMDEWGVDVAVAASQKGLMVPPGLGFVWAGPRALASHRTAGLRTKYWDWTSRTEVGPHYLRFAGTPPVLHLFGLREALRMIDEEGLEARWRRHEVLADAVRAAVLAWATPGGIELEILDEVSRANAVTSILTGSIDVAKLAATCQQRAGLTLGAGIGAYKDSSFRIGHMGHVNAPMLLGSIGTVEAALIAQDASLGASGVEAAARTIGRALARP